MKIWHVPLILSACAIFASSSFGQSSILGQVDPLATDSRGLQLYNVSLFSSYSYFSNAKGPTSSPSEVGIGNFVVAA